jgi:hypothetical protein
MRHQSGKLKVSFESLVFRGRYFSRWDCLASEIEGSNSRLREDGVSVFALGHERGKQVTPGCYCLG